MVFNLAFEGFISIKVCFLGTVMRSLYNACCIALPAVGYQHLGVTECEPHSPCSALCLYFKCIWRGVEAITRVAVGYRLPFLCSLQQHVRADKFILLANLLDTLASLLNSKQSSQALFHLDAVIVAIMILCIVLNSVHAKLVWQRN
jgi:hypothetical protein